MDASTYLKKTENAVRGVISIIMFNRHGDNWIDHIGFDDEKITKWRGRMATEENRLGNADTRLIFYSDFYDLKTVILKNWNSGFSEVFGKKKKFEQFWETIEGFRDSDAHRRALLPYQMDLLKGVDGWIRTKIHLFYMKEEDASSYYAKLDSINTNVGVSWAIGDKGIKKFIMRPGEVIELSVSGSDPEGRNVTYHCVYFANGIHKNESIDGNFRIEIEESHIAERTSMWIAIQSNGQYHPKTITGTQIKVDDIVMFSIEVLPPKREC